MHENVRRAIVRGFYPGPRWRARVMAMTDEEIERMYQAKLNYVRDQGETEMQTRLRAEDNEAHPNGSQQ
jgi:hypothetical protein